MPAYRRNKSKRGRRRRKAYIPRSPTLGLPIRKFVKMRYVQNIVLDVGVAGIIAKYVFRANSLFDPNLTGTGHQPMTFDQMSLFYNHYVVSGAKISVKAYSTQDAATVPALVGIMVNDDTTTPSNFTEVLEQRKGRYSIVNPSQKAVSVYNTYSAKKFFNITDVKDNLDRIGASIGDNPTDDAYFTIYALPMNGSTDIGAFNCVVTIDYTAHFSEPRDLATS